MTPTQEIAAISAEHADNAYAGQIDGAELWRGRQWCVTTTGIFQIAARPGVAPYYWIDRADVGMRHWPEHMASKGWVDVEDFCLAYAIASTVFTAGGNAELGRQISAAQAARKAQKARWPRWKYDPTHPDYPIYRGVI
ncbi:MAG: hypothetical protein J0H17_13910 [Rhizobiales bacterium]|nr:hypothetical protein [Hyphomicrobiales bacterium]